MDPPSPQEEHPNFGWALTLLGPDSTDWPEEAHPIRCGIRLRHDLFFMIFTHLGGSPWTGRKYVGVEV
jgi:hypothetical protein